jgi:hypothetical protein
MSPSLERRVLRLERILCAFLLTNRLKEYPDSRERALLEELARELDALDGRKVSREQA